MIDELKGIGHFTIWFLVGFLVFSWIKPCAQQRPKLTALTLYAPFIPFFLGIIGVVPYLLFVLGSISHETALSGVFNLFLFYGVISRVEVLSNLFSNFEIDAVLLASLYLYLVAYYIDLVKKIRAGYAQ